VTFFQDGNTALHCAAFCKFEEAVKILLRMGAATELLNKVRDAKLPLMESSAFDEISFPLICIFSTELQRCI